MSNYFGSEITRKIWSRLDVIILIYVGSAADFPLCKENHWLFFTNKLPSDPQKRFVDTFIYNQKLFFTPKEKLPALLSDIRKIHHKIEADRSSDGEMKISNQAFLEVFFMLTDYALRGYEYIEQCKLTEEDKTSYVKDIKAITEYMRVQDFPENYSEFQIKREESITNDLMANSFTDKLYDAYLKDLGSLRFWILVSFQREFIPEAVSRKLKLKRNPVFFLLYKIYPRIHNPFFFRMIIKILLKPDTEKALLKLNIKNK